jgi:hypothetical protein|tara:strand:+ start:1887 stop:2030 length:144 start_codon:yes stop_codon:yes gene_type:complete
MQAWEVNIGIFPGVLFGIRQYEEDYKTDYVLYLGFIDICFTAYYEEE